jgi:hypothetical protein
MAHSQGVSSLWIEIGFDALTLGLFVSAVILLFLRTKTRDAVLLVAGGVFCALMGNPDRLATVKFTFTGVEATARQAIQEVQISLQQLQKLATSLAEGSLNELAFTGSIFVGMSNAEKFRIRDQIVDQLKGIGVPERDILQAQRIWRYFYCDIVEGMIEQRLREVVPQTDIEIEVKQLRKDDEFKLPSPDTLRDWITPKKQSDARLTELLEEYERVWTTGTMKTPNLIPFGMHPRGQSEN